MSSDAFPPSIQLAFDLTYDELFKVNKHLMASEKKARESELCSSLLMMAIALAGLIVLFSARSAPSWPKGPNSPPPPPDFFNGMWWVAFCGVSLNSLALILRLIETRNKFKRLVISYLSNGIGRAYIGKLMVKIDSGGVEYSSDSAVKRLKWNVISDISIEDGFVWLWQGSFVADVIPERAFSSLTERNAFMEAAKSFHQAALVNEEAAESNAMNNDVSS